MKNVVFAKRQMWLGTDKRVCKCDHSGAWEMVYMVGQCFTLFAVAMHSWLCLYLKAILIYILKALPVSIITTVCVGLPIRLIAIISAHNIPPPIKKGVVTSKKGNLSNCTPLQR